MEREAPKPRRPESRMSSSCVDLGLSLVLRTVVSPFAEQTLAGILFFRNPLLAI
jgi:hypothetical protein